MRKRYLIPAVLVATVLTGYLAAEIYRSRDYLEFLVNRKGALAGSREEVVAIDGSRNGDTRLVQVVLRDENALEVTAFLRRPAGGAGPYPVILALGGVRTGKEVVNYLGDTPGIMVCALDYPYAGKKSGFGVWEFVSEVPAIRRALLNTVPAAMLAVDYLIQRDDVDPARIVFVGGSVGAMFGPAVGAADERLAGVALLFGAANLRAVFKANIHAPPPLPGLGGWAISVLLSPLEPLKYIGRIAPRPVFMLNGTGDSRMPVDSSRQLHEAAGAPKTIRWIDTGHVDIRSTQFHALVKGEIAAWLASNGLAPAIPADARQQ